MATSQPKNAAPTFEPPNRSRTSAGTAATGPVTGSATGSATAAVVHDGGPILLVLHSGHGARVPRYPHRETAHGTMGGATYEEES